MIFHVYDNEGSVVNIDGDCQAGWSTLGQEERDTQQTSFSMDTFIKYNWVMRILNDKDSDMEKVPSSLAVLVEKSRKKA